MMLENQVCSPEPAKKLKELGVKQKKFNGFCDFAYNKVGDLQLIHVDNDTGWVLGNNYSESFYEGEENSSEAPWNEKYVKAFTVAELGEMLPSYWFPFLDDEREYMLEQFKDVKGFNIIYQRVVDGKQFEHIVSGSEADARAKMLIYLLENNLMTL